MKRLLFVIFSLTLIFSFSPLHNVVKAEESANSTVKAPEQPTTPEVKPPASDVKQVEQTKPEDKGTTSNQPTEQKPPASNDGQNNTGDNNSQNPAPTTNVKLEVHRQLTEKGYKITGTLKDVKSATGTWTFYFQGKKVHSKKNSATSASFEQPMNDIDMTGYIIKVVFEGKADGKDVKISQEATIPDLNLVYEKAGNKDKFTGTLVPGKNAQGDWAIIVSDKNGEEIIDDVNVTDRKGTSFTHTFSGLSKGTYVVGMIFVGKVDGEDTAIIKYVTLEVTKEGNGGDIKPPPTDYKPTKPVTEHTAKQIIKNTHKGGPMPKTASSYPTSMAMGFAILALGLTLLGYRRFAQQK